MEIRESGDQFKENTMGRPLNKKYFGNTNTDEIGGRSVTGVTLTGVGSYVSTLPTVTFPLPGIYEGTQAAGTVHGNALSAATTSNGTGYHVGDVLTVAGGIKTSAATFPVASITTLGTPGITNGGSLYDPGDGSNGDRVTYTHANLSTPFRVRVTATAAGGIATAIVVEQQGVWTGTGAFPTSMAGGVGGFTATCSGGPIDNNGTGLVLSFTGSNWGVYSFGAVAVQGDYTAMPANPASFTGGNGTGTAATITFGVSGITINTAGDGYVTTQSASVTFAPTGATGTMTLGPNPQPGTILLNAATQTSTPYNNSDIIKQESTATYKVRNQGGTAFCALQTSTPNAPGEATLIAIDSSGSTYYVVKLCAHLATLVQKTDGGSGFEFRSLTNPVWTLDDPVADYSVQIYND